MKRVVITANTSWYLFNFRAGTIKALIIKGYEVTAVAPDDEYRMQLLDLGCRFSKCYLDKASKNPFKDLLAILSYTALYWKTRPDFVLNFTPKVNIYSTFAAKLVKAYIANNIAGLGVLFVSESFSSSVALFLYRLSQPLADFIFFQNEDDIKLFETRKILRSDKYERLPGSGVDLARFVIKEAPDDDVVRFVLVARMIREKGIHQYVEAARRIKSQHKRCEFYLIGAIDEATPSAIVRHEIEQWEAEGILVYLGKTDDIVSVVARMDCVVLPSFYREGVPKSLLEAAAMGKPIVTTASIGCKETIIDGVSGYLCAPHDAESLARSLFAVINDGHEKRLAMGRSGRQYIASNFDEKLVITKYLDVLSRAYTDSSSGSQPILPKE